MTAPLFLSIVTTTYNSSQVIDEFLERACAVALAVTTAFEIVVVDDGSSDDTLAKLDTALGRDVPLKVVSLSRNFGHHKALLTGLGHADGDLVFLVDSDLEEEPELLQDFYATMNSEQADVVFGIQAARNRGGAQDKAVGSLFYRVYNFLSETKIPDNLCVIRLMTRRYVDALMSYRETEMIIGSLWALTGFHQVSRPVSVRYKGYSSYSIVRKMRLALDAIISTSTLPLKIYFWFSCAVTLVAFFVFLYLLVLYLIVGIAVPGYYTIVGSIWLTAGFVSSGLGLIGLYMSVIMKEVKLRPRTVVRSIKTNPEHRRRLPSDRTDRVMS